MKKLLLILLIAVPVIGQDQPSIPIMQQLTSERYFQELGQLHMQLIQRDEYISLLQKKVAELQAELTKLKSVPANQPD